MRSCIFIGPSGLKMHDYEGITVLPPVSLGAVYRAVEAGYEQIAIVDGYFGNIPSVWHKEILFALARGKQVWGAGSMGAVRAAELFPFGMRGVGIAYRLFRRQALTDDDEVCLVHGAREFDYACLTYPMINMRVSLRRLRRHQLISCQEEENLLAAFKLIHFGVRDKTVVKLIFESSKSLKSRNLWSSFLRYYVDVKQFDARCLVRQLLAHSSNFPKNERVWEFPETSHWLHQFRTRADEIPLLGSDPA